LVLNKVLKCFQVLKKVRGKNNELKEKTNRLINKAFSVLPEKKAIPAENLY
jgi:hypothetical protein